MLDRRAQERVQERESFKAYSHVRTCAALAHRSLGARVTEPRSCVGNGLSCHRVVRVQRDALGSYFDTSLAKQAPVATALTC